MKALVYTGPKHLEFGTFADPEPRDGEALVAVDCCGICGSDMHAWAGHDERRPAPLVLGHEIAGVVETGDLAGQRVTINPLVSCGTCIHCRAGRENLCQTRQILSMPPRQGGFAERAVIPTSNIVEVPDHVALEKAALAEPLACGWHGVRVGLEALHPSLRAMPALAIGGGAIGLGAALAARAAGLTDITLCEPNDGRRARIAETTGLPVVADVSDRIGAFGLVLDGVGLSATRALASSVVMPGGVIVHIGLGDRDGGLDVRRMTLQEVQFIGTYTYTHADFRATSQAIFDGSLGSLDWFETAPLSDGAASFAKIAAGQAMAPKIVLKT
ncbi:MAG: alcohol dehydrogenase catalytic domain-containing protein [Pseudomonadota bacterium]